MCGIFSLLLDNKTKLTKDEVKEYFNRIHGRGPEDSKFLNFENYYKLYLGFHRLRINDISDEGNQPFYEKYYQKEFYCVTNGEIYNYKKLAKDYDVELKSKSDCEIILKLYLKIGYKVFNLLDGVFAGVIMCYDKLNDNYTLTGFRDRYGVRPLYFGMNNGDKLEYGFCSELKGLSGLFENIRQFEPGYIYRVDTKDMLLVKQRYCNNYFKLNKLCNKSYEQILLDVKEKLILAVKKRMMSDRPMCCLLSGGLDSSLVASILARESKEPITTFCIGLEGGSDFKYAKIVANYIKSNHYEIVLKKEDFLNAIPKVIETIESYDITTVRASTGQYLICKYISENTDFKVVYIGDGSDEVTGGYKYFVNAPTEDDFNRECKRLTSDIHYYDGLRADRAVSCHGLETRVPFLDKEFVNYYMGIPLKYRYEETKKGNEKYLLRKAFDGYLPEEVLWRQKEAFSDGVSKKSEKSEKDESWYNIIQNYVKTKVSVEEYEKGRGKYSYLMPYSVESYYYRKVFSEKYEGNDRVVPYFWLPKWVGNELEPSARVLDVYK
jgi:asparagine synthase (glutamine-hydrolysing)